MSASCSRLLLPRDRDLSPDERVAANRALGDVLFADLRAFVARASTERGDGANLIDLVVVEHVLAPELAHALFGPDVYIAGLGVSPRFLENLPADDPDHALDEMLGLPAAFTPLAVIGAADLARVTGSPDNVVAHEVGHALGLPHTIADENLLAAGPGPDCEATLSAAQLDELRPAVASSTSALTTSVHLVAINPASLMSAILRRWAAR